MSKPSFFVLIQYISPQRLLTQFAGWVASRRIKWLKNRLIEWFIRRYQVDMTSALFQQVDDFPDFNSFFTRALKPSARPIAAEPNAIVSPADSCVSQIGRIEQNQLVQAKNFNYTTEALLSSKELAKEFDHGFFATLYLAPKDYHRVHMPLTGKLRKTIFIPGQLFSVNQETASGIPNLFARNERLVCLFDTAAGPMAVILVGAMIVGSINSVWQEDYKFKQITEQTPQDITLQKGAELGHFQLGSTVILLFAKDAMHWQGNLRTESVVKMGQTIGSLLETT